MNTFALTNGLRNFLIILIGIGVLSLGLTWINDDDLHSRFWSNLLHNATFFTLISLLATFFIAVCITAYAGWHTVFKRIFEAFSMFLIPGVALMLIIALAVYLHGNHLYHWADKSVVETDPVLKGKSSFLNVNWYFFGTLIIGGTWAWFAYKLRALSIAEDNLNADPDFSTHRKMRIYAATFLPIAGFTSCALVWQWIMSVDSHWYSTLFAWYTLASAFVAMIALTIIVLIYLKAQGYYQNVTQEHLHDLGKFLFAFSIFWAYLWFSQFMLIWYANVGEETIYFKERYERYPVLFFANIAVNFVLPFFVLMRNDTKRKIGSLIFTAIVVFIFHWIDYFLMIKPGVNLTREEVLHHGMQSEDGLEAVAHHGSQFISGFTLPGFLELGTFLGFLGLFFMVAAFVLSKSQLTPKNDPYLQESLHHHV